MSRRIEAQSIKAMVQEPQTAMTRSAAVLNSVHAIESPLSAESETVCASPLCSNRFKPSGMAASPKRHCSEQCRQECSIIKRAAKLLNVLSDVEIVKLIREQ